MIGSFYKTVIKYNSITSNIDVKQRLDKARDQLEAKGQTMSAEDEQKLKAPILEKYETEGHPLYATARLWDDGVVDPRQTRSALALAFSASLNQPIPDWRAPVFRM